MKKSTSLNALKNIRLLVGAAEAEAGGINIAEEFIPQVAQARAELVSMKGVEVLEALIQCRRSGLNLAMDVRQRNRYMGSETSERRPGRA